MGSPKYLMSILIMLEPFYDVMLNKPGKIKVLINKTFEIKKFFNKVNKRLLKKF